MLGVAPGFLQSGATGAGVGVIDCGGALDGVDADCAIRDRDPNRQFQIVRSSCCHFPSAAAGPSDLAFSFLLFPTTEKKVSR